MFKKKLNTLYSAMKRASRSAGKKVKLLMNVWEIGPKYKFTIFYSELDASEC